MEVKILCPCGAKYKFDVEPAGGRLPGPVQCPVCGADGTAAGNAILAQSLAASPASVAASAPAAATRLPATASAATHPGMIPRSAAPAIPKSSKEIMAASAAATAPASAVEAPPAPIAVSTPAVAPAPSAKPMVIKAPAAAPVAAVTPPIAPTPGAPSRLSVSVHKPETAPASAVHSPPTAAPGPASAVPAARPSRPISDGPSTMMGLLGALIGGTVGAVVWILIAVGLNSEIGWIAWGMGGLIGWLSVLLAKGAGPKIGLAAAAVACVAILASQYLSTGIVTSRVLDTLAEMTYEMELEYAKKVTAAKTDDELKAIIAENESDDTTTRAAADVSAKELSDFKTKELPDLRKLAEGKTSRATHAQKFRAELESDPELSGVVMENSFSKWTILWLFLGVGTAFRVGSGVK